MVLIRLSKFLTAGFLAVLSFAVLPSDAVADSNVAVLAFGLDGSQSVFESEAKGAAAILAQRLGAGNVVTRANTKTRGDVTIEAIKAAVQSAAVKMDRERDLAGPDPDLAWITRRRRGAGRQALRDPLATRSRRVA
jgi:hypothetical protein